jgi:hypothetical protein
LGKASIDPLAYLALYNIGNEKEKHNITHLNLLLTNGNNVVSDFTMNLIAHSSNNSFNVGDYRSLRYKTTIILVKKCTRGWDYKEHCHGVSCSPL